MALILCIETGTSVCSVALTRDGQCVAVRESAEGRDHARLLGVYVDEILRTNSISPEELDAVAVGKGPGSYTGLRIGVSLAKGMCYALGIPLVAIGSLEALTRVAADDLRAGQVEAGDAGEVLFCPMIDARRMEVYTQVFDASLRPLTEVAAEIVTPAGFPDFLGSEAPPRPFLIFGNGAAKSLEVLPSERVKYLEVTPSARGMAALAQEAFDAGRFEEIAYFEPFYLKDFIVLESTKKMW